MELELKGRTALVSGASSGIGAGIARVLAKQGVRVAITARRSERLIMLATEIEHLGAETPVVVTGDITEADDVARIVVEAESALGAIDILVNNAGGSRQVAAISPESAWDEAFALNFSAARRFAEALLPRMRTRRWGRIINISGSMEPRTLNAASAAKAALHLWAKGLSCDVAADGVTVNTIPPGRINSEQTLTKLHPTEDARRAFIAGNIPAGYFGEPEDIGYLVAFLASPLARYITGAVIPVDGGMHYFAH
ncbi:3-oxoacyl-[acyl-carrier protein] reductase [Paraburkholderia caribensis MBA4]|uniref:3-oxoacyl-[acyl-carrier protein] reductase n=1 Tax=Paraburkholderia caribensis MBA4 TaxID=1323664 RepID=A0A0P0R544_9BURK|nr:SDR family oxidoreductase [Paraburkholderia caribensis]ALL63112.1 3-oxoacyl-[acyl-carrier protein] reductase [Paraburkholderia caribensis MBA4]